MSGFEYRGPRTREIRFPLGGLGTGCISLAGNGRLVDWEIFNRPNKGSVNGFSHFAIKAEAGGEVIDTRVLNADLPPPYAGSGPGNWDDGGSGFGPRREYMSGLPHFRDLVFRGEFPFARIHLEEPKFPGEVQLEAFNPFIPLNERDSSIPAAMFQISVTNTTREPISYTLAATLGNPLPANNVNSVGESNGFTYMHLASSALEPHDIGYGDLTLATDADEVSYQQHWFRGDMFDALEVYWTDLTTPGGFPNRVYPPGATGDRNNGVLAARIDVEPGETGSVRFVISWSFPNCENYWRPEHARRLAEEADVETTWRNHYATVWRDSKGSALYALENWGRLRSETELFRDSLFSSHLPDVALEAVSANLSTLKTPTVMRLEDGTFYGWEGCQSESGCCEGSCTHVWNYAQALPFLFPALERSMRDADYRYNQQPDGGMPFRLQLPLGIKHPSGRSCADGLFGGVMKIYRDWKICGDTDWLRSIWPAVRRSLEFAWSGSNHDRWDPDRTGVLQGRQHHTLDRELFGPNAWLTGFYLGALKAAAEMAEHLGETESAEDYRDLFDRGKSWVDEHLFNGEYYHQVIDIDDSEIPAGFEALDGYWDPEHGEIKYQIGEGCEIDQVLAQWHANIYGLGEIFDPGQTRTALESIYRYNFKRSMRDFYNPCRVYCLNDEAGLVICEWPEGKRRPIIPLPYSQETQNGYEWAAAIQMIQTGLIEEGLTCARAIRDRYDGERRNPWNEIECGNHYARSMATYALLNAFSGFRFDMVRGMIGFDPIAMRDGRFRCFWSLESGWGELETGPRHVELTVHYGHLQLRVLDLPFLAQRRIQSASLDNSEIGFTGSKGEAVFVSEVRIERGQSLVLRVA
jgi:uncharacterized protein (DUF608 family)